MQTIAIKQGQNFYDVVLEATGDINNVWIMAKANNINPTATLSIGTEIIVAGTIKKSVLKELIKRPPATLFVDTDTAAPVYLDYLLPSTFPFL